MTTRAPSIMAWSLWCSATMAAPLVTPNATNPQPWVRNGKTMSIGATTPVMKAAASRRSDSRDAVAVGGPTRRPAWSADQLRHVEEPHDQRYQGDRAGQQEHEPAQHDVGGVGHGRGIATYTRVHHQVKARTQHDAGAGDARCPTGVYAQRRSPARDATDCEQPGTVSHPSDVARHVAGDPRHARPLFVISREQVHGEHGPIAERREEANSGSRR